MTWRVRGCKNEVMRLLLALLAVLALLANPVTAAALAKVRVKPWQVAGVQIGSNGALRLYIFSSRNW